MPVPVAIAAAAPLAGKAVATAAAATGATLVGIKAQQYARRKAGEALSHAEESVAAFREARRNEQEESDAQERKAS